MATILSLKRRIDAARNVSKTTRAMQMISASKLKKAQGAAVSTRPYVSGLEALTKNLVAGIDKQGFDHIYVKNKAKTGKKLLIVVGPDKGLCGGLVGNLMKAFARFYKDNQETYVVSVGKKVEGQAARLSKNVVASFAFGTITPTYDIIFPLMKIVDEYYLGGKVDEVYVLYTDFVSFFTQNPTVVKLMPVEGALDQSDEKSKNDPYMFEPNAEEILPELLRHRIEISLYHAFLESFASEQASRMLTMQNATNNANDIIEDLRLEYNKTRQAKITSELLDITGAGLASA